MSKKNQTTKLPDPRNNADDAYKGFMSMGEDEWRGLFDSLASGGVLQVEENKGYKRALKERGLPKKNPPKTAGTEHAQKMGRINQDVAKASALVVQHPIPALAVKFTDLFQQAKDHTGFGLQAVAAMTALKDMTPEQEVLLHDYTKSIEDAVSETEKFARARVLNYALQHGEVFGDKGLSRQFRVGNKLQKVTVNKSGLDAKTVEAAIRAKQLDPAKFMTPTTTFSLNDMTRQLLVQGGYFSEDELTALEQKPTFRVERSKEVGDE